MSPRASRDVHCAGSSRAARSSWVSVIRRGEWNGHWFENVLHGLSPVRTLIGVEPAAISDRVRSSTQSEEGLWRRSLEGDGAAFGRLFDLHRDRVFRHACRLAESRQDAEDLVASTFLEFWRCRGARPRCGWFGSAVVARDGNEFESQRGARNATVPTAHRATIARR